MYLDREYSSEINMEIAKMGHETWQFKGLVTNYGEGGGYKTGGGGT